MTQPAVLSRDSFDKAFNGFRTALADTVLKAPHECPFLETQPLMLDSLRFQDHLYKDLCTIAPFLTRETQVLDIGTGSGIAAFMLASQGCRVEGIDIDCFNTSAAHANIGAEQKLAWQTMMKRLPSLHFQHYFNSRIPFADSTFDMVVAYGVIEHIPEDVLALVTKEIARVTKPGGHLIISYLPRKLALLELLLKLLGRPYHLRRWGDKEIHQLLVELGYSVRISKRVIFAPQFPPALANRHKRLFDAIDKLAGVPLFSLLARDIFVAAQKDR